MEQALLTAPEVARRLRVTTSTIHNWVNSGQIKAFRLPGGGPTRRGRVRIPLEEVEAIEKFVAEETG